MGEHAQRDVHRYVPGHHGAPGVRDLGSAGYAVLAVVEQTERKRLATVRLRSPSGVVVDLLAASSGIEQEVTGRAQPVAIEGAGTVPVARAEELLALKVLSMSEARPQDRIDASSLLAANDLLDLGDVRDLLARITERGFHRQQDLAAKLDALLANQKGSPARGEMAALSGFSTESTSPFDVPFRTPSQRAVAVQGEDIEPSGSLDQVRARKARAAIA